MQIGGVLYHTQTAIIKLSEKSLITLSIDFKLFEMFICNKFILKSCNFDEKHLADCDIGDFVNFGYLHVFMFLFLIPDVNNRRYRLPN